MTEIRAEMVANVWQVLVEEGEAIAAGAQLLVLESMKMEIPVESPVSGTVTGLHVVPGQVLAEGDLIVVVE